MSTLTFGQNDFFGGVRVPRHRLTVTPRVASSLPATLEPVSRLGSVEPAWRTVGGVALLVIALHLGAAWQLSHRQTSGAPLVSPPLQLNIEVTPPKPLPQTVTPPKPLPQQSKPSSEPLKHAAAPRAVTPPLAPAPTAQAAPSPDTIAVAQKPAPIAAPVEPAVTEASGDAEYLHNPAPNYPMVAQEQGWQGRVMLKVHVLAAGQADSVSVAVSSGRKMLDEAALKAVSHWTFAPARRGTEAIDGWVTVPIDFTLG